MAQNGIDINVALTLILIFCAKSYIAYEDTTTALHFDVSDAVNLLVHVGPDTVATETESKYVQTKEGRGDDLITITTEQD